MFYNLQVELYRRKHYISSLRHKPHNYPCMFNKCGLITNNQVYYLSNILLIIKIPFKFNNLLIDIHQLINMCTIFVIINISRLRIIPATFYILFRTNLSIYFPTKTLLLTVVNKPVGMGKFRLINTRFFRQ